MTIRTVDYDRLFIARPINHGSAKVTSRVARG
jgi:hypothetical protein